MDTSHLHFEDHISVVTQTINEIKAGDKPILLVFDKIDLVDKMSSEEESMQMSELELAESRYVDIQSLSDFYEKENGIKPIFMAAASGDNVEEFRHSLTAEVKKQHRKIYPHYLEDEIVTWEAQDEA